MILHKSFYETETQLAMIVDLQQTIEEEPTPGEIEGIDQETRELVKQYVTQAVEKRDAMAFFLADLDSKIELYGNEIKRMQLRRRAMENAAKRLRSHIVQVMQEIGADRLSGQTHTLSLARVPKSVEITDESSVPLLYKRTIPETTEPDKNAIKNALSRGVQVPGAKLSEQVWRLNIR